MVDVDFPMASHKLEVWTQNSTKIHVNHWKVWIHQAGVIKLTILGDQTMLMYGNFDKANPYNNALFLVKTWRPHTSDFPQNGGLVREILSTLFFVEVWVGKILLYLAS